MTRPTGYPGLRLMIGLHRRWLLRRQARRIAASGAFDPGWYRSRYRDVAKNPDPLRHYLEWGYREGRLPNPIFDSGWYLAHYFPGVADPPNPLIDYLRHLERDPRRPNRWFDPAWYRRAADVPPPQDPMLHYLAAGRTAGDPGPDFDSSEVIRQFPALDGHATTLGFHLDRYRIQAHLTERTGSFISGWAGREVGAGHRSAGSREQSWGRRRRALDRQARRARSSRPSRSRILLFVPEAPSPRRRRLAPRRGRRRDRRLYVDLSHRAARRLGRAARQPRIDRGPFPGRQGRRDRRLLAADRSAAGPRGRLLRPLPPPTSYGPGSTTKPAASH